MRVGVVTTSFPRFAGDPAGSFVGDHVRWLRDQGHRVDVIAAGTPGAEATLDGSPVYRVPAPASLFYAGGAPEALEAGARLWLGAMRFSARLTAEVARRSGQWDAVMAHWLVPSAAAAALAARRCPVLAIAHSGDVHLLRRARLCAPIAALFRATGTRLVFVTEQLRELFLSAVPGVLRHRLAEAVVCSMGVDVARFRGAASDDTGTARKTVLFLGRLVPVKGIDALIDASARWRSNARLIVAGAGPDREQLQRRANELPATRAELVGEVHGAVRDELLASADVLVLPSVEVGAGRSEGLPVTVLEAMAAGVPIVASSVGGLAGLPPTSVRFVPPRDPAAIADAVDDLLADPASRARQVGAASAFVEGRDWSVIGPRLMTALG